MGAIPADTTAALAAHLALNTIRAFLLFHFDSVFLDV